MCVSVDLTHSLFVLRPMLWVVTHIGWIVEAAAQADARCRCEAGQGRQKFAEEERVNKYRQMYKYKYKYKLKQMLAAALKPVKADKNMLKRKE